MSPCRWLLGLLFFVGVLPGCQRASRYSAPGPAASGKKDTHEEEKKSPLPADVVWERGGRSIRSDLPSDVPIRFVHAESDPKEWARLKQFWNDSMATDAARAAGIVGLAGKAALAGAPMRKRVILIRVPLGLDDPAEYIPSANPPTRGKWELGRRLFFDAKWLTAGGKQSCATCHIPNSGYTDGKREVRDSYNTPTLINVVYNRYQFWDGRVRYLEDVVQTTLEDERESESRQPFRHTWSGVISRLRGNQDYVNQFQVVFGTKPTQVAVGRAIATYLRTILAGNSIHDRAVRVQKQKGASTLDETHYAEVLTDTALKELPGAGKGGGVAARLARGHALFRGKAGCIGCHTAGKGPIAPPFHNIGVGLAEYTGPKGKGKRVGRFAAAPLGEKSRYLIGAYKTPTLRSLLRTGPYFHNGEEDDLKRGVRFHVAPPASQENNLYRDPLLSKPNGEPKDFHLSDDDIGALVLFLEALNGEDVDAAIRARPPAEKVKK